MARKVSPELLAEHQGELGIWKSTKKGKEFDALLNFNFDVTTKVSLGEQLGSGAVYVVRVPGEETRFVRIYAIRPLSVSAKTRNVRTLCGQV